MVKFWFCGLHVNECTWEVARTTCTGWEFNVHVHFNHSVNKNV